MTGAPATASLEGADPICPWLGLPDDPSTHFSFATEAHRCHAARRPFAPDRAKQARDCVTAAHVSCSRYRPRSEPSRGGRLLRVAIVEESVRSAPVATGTVGVRPVRAGHRTGGALRLILFAILVLLAILGGQQLGSWLAAQVASVAPAVTSSAQPSTTPMSTVAPTPTADPMAEPTAGLSPLATPVVHVIVLNETLSGIARRYGVTVDALRAANGITDPNLIVVGQRLVIPLP